MIELRLTSDKTGAKESFGLRTIEKFWLNPEDGSPLFASTVDENGTQVEKQPEGGVLCTITRFMPGMS